MRAWAVKGMHLRGTYENRHYSRRRAAGITALALTSCGTADTDTEEAVTEPTGGEDSAAVTSLPAPEAVEDSEREPFTEGAEREPYVANGSVSDRPEIPGVTFYSVPGAWLDPEDRNLGAQPVDEITGWVEAPNGYMWGVHTVVDVDELLEARSRAA